MTASRNQVHAGRDGTPGLVSVVIPAFNAQQFLQECLASVLAQGGVSMEVIVVDDGSEDGTAQIASDTPGVKCVLQRHSGPSSARNAGIAKSSGEFIAFLDADDLWPEDKLRLQIELLEEHPNVAMVFGDCRQFNRAGPWTVTLFQAAGYGLARWGTSTIVPHAYQSLLGNNFITTGSVVLRRSVIESIGGFATDLSLVEDLDLWLRIAREHDLGWCNKVCLFRRRHENNLSRDTENMALAYIEVLRRQFRSESGRSSVWSNLLHNLIATEYGHIAKQALYARRLGKAWSYALSGLRERVKGGRARMFAAPAAGQETGECQR